MQRNGRFQSLGDVNSSLHSSAAAALATCAATYTVQAGESPSIPCTVGLGAGLPCRRLSRQLVADSGRRSMRSAERRVCFLPRQNSTYGDRSFAAAGPRPSCVTLGYCYEPIDYLQCTLEDIFILLCI